MQTSLKREKDGTIEITVTIPWQEVKRSFNRLFEKALSQVKIKGFRKGKAPKKLAEKRVDKEKVYQEVVGEIIPRFYLQAIKEHGLCPIIAPKVELLAANEEKDWRFKASFCEKPKVILGDYKKAIRKLNPEKKPKIWVPGKATESADKRATKQQKPRLDEILDTLFKTVKVKIPQLLLEDQLSRSLANLLDQIQKLGLTVDQYLKAEGKTAEQLKEEYRKRAEKTLALEFILEKIADEEKITVSEREIDELINKERDKRIQEQLKTRRYYLASLLRRQKTLERLSSS